MGRACQNETVEGVGGWACQNEGGKAWICQNEHPGAHFRKSEGWGVAGPAKTRMVRVEVAKPAKKRAKRPG